MSEESRASRTDEAIDDPMNIQRLLATLPATGRRIDEPRTELPDHLRFVTPTEAALTICELMVAIELTRLEMTREWVQRPRAA